MLNLNAIREHKTHEDKLHDEAMAAATTGLLEQLKRFVANNPAREVRSLNRTELMLAAHGAIDAWALKRAEIEAREREQSITRHWDILA